MFIAVWDRAEFSTSHTEFYQRLSKHYDNVESGFLEIPHSCSSLDELKTLLENAGFVDIAIQVVRKEIKPARPVEICTAYLLGTPLYTELREKGIDPQEAVHVIANDMEDSFGEWMRGFYRQALFMKAIK